MGRAISVDGVPVTAINASSGSAIREWFLHIYLNQDGDKDTACRAVRRYFDVLLR